MEEFKLSAEEVPRRVGRDRATIANTVAPAELPTEVQACSKRANSTWGTPGPCLAVEGAAAQKAIGLKAAREGWSVRRGGAGGRNVPALARPDAAGGPARPPAMPMRGPWRTAYRRKLGAKVTLRTAGKGGRIEIALFHRRGIGEAH